MWQKGMRNIITHVFPLFGLSGVGERKYLSKVSTRGPKTRGLSRDKRPSPESYPRMALPPSEK